MNILNYFFRGGEHPNLQIEEIEREVQEKALKRFMGSSANASKGLKWNYNLTHFETFYCSQDPRILNVLFNLRPYPDYIEIEATTYCDMKCEICENKYWTNENRVHIKYSQFLYIMEQFPNLKWIGLTGIGQSFLNPNYMKMIEHCKKKGIYIEIFDSFLHLNEKKIKHLVELGFDKIYVSLDAATKETYQKLREGSNWDKVIQNIKLLDKWKKIFNSYFPELCFHYIIGRNNVHEVEQFLDFVHELNVDVSFVQFTRLLHCFKEVEHLFIDIPDSFKEQIIKHGLELGIKVTFNINSTESKDKPPLNTCSVWTQPFIFADGTVIPCCSLNEQNDRDWQRATSLGNIFMEDFRTIWYGERYTEMLEDIKSGKLPKSCERCVLRKF